MGFINVSAITAALKAQLEGSSFMTGFVAIERGQIANSSPAHTPWCCIYRSGVEYDPHTLGPAANAWKGILTLEIVVQAVAMNGEEAAEDSIESAVTSVLNAVYEDKTIDGNVEMMTGLSVEYTFDSSEEETMIYQQANIEVQYEVRTS